MRRFKKIIKLMQKLFLHFAHSQAESTFLSIDLSWKCHGLSLTEA